MEHCKHFHAPGVLHEPCPDCAIEEVAQLRVELATVKQQRDELGEALEEITALVAEREHWPDVVSRCRAALAKVKP